jgi:hypothetical protein
VTADNETNQPSLNIVKQSTSLREKVSSAIGFKTRQTSTLSVSREELLASKLDEETLKASTLEPGYRYEYLLVSLYFRELLLDLRFNDLEILVVH